MTRVAMVHPFDPLGSKVGGIETMVRSLMRHAPDYVDVDLIGVTEDPEARPCGQWSDVTMGDRTCRLYPVFTVEKPNQRTKVPLFLRFPLTLQTNRLDLSDAVLVYHRWEPAIFRRKGCRGRVLCVHSDIRQWAGKGSEVRWRHAPWAFHALESWLLPTLDRVHVVSRSGLDDYNTRHAEAAEKFSFLPTWFEPGLFDLPDPDARNTARERLLRETGWPERALVVLFAGRFEAQKDPLLAVEVIERAAKRHPDLRALFIGDGALREACREKIAEAGLEEKVRFLDAMPPEELATCFCGGDAFLMTSRFEGMPTIVLEAQACGLQVVAPDVGELERMVQQGVSGAVVERDADCLAESLVERLDACNFETRAACARAVETCRAGDVVGDFYWGVRRIAETRKPQGPWPSVPSGL